MAEISEDMRIGGEKSGHMSSMVVSAPPVDLKSLIYLVRGQQVMLDSDLAMLYGVETKRLNENVRRNKDRFPESFCFQLNADEIEILRPQVATSSTRGGRRYHPYVFTEQGIAMLSAVLRSKTAVEVSVHIMNTFVEMRRFIAGNAALFERVSEVELRQLEYQKRTDKRFEKVFGLLDSHEEPSQKIFFDGQIFDAFELLVDIIQKAKKSIVLVDGYVDMDTLNILAKRRANVSVLVYTTKRGNRLTDTDVAKFNAQYPLLEVRVTTAFHDRFLILDNVLAYHVGASLKDAGKKCFAINRIESESLVEALLGRLG